MWNVVKSAVKEFVVALNEEDDEADTSNTANDLFPFPDFSGVNEKRLECELSNPAAPETETRLSPIEHTSPIQTALVEKPVEEQSNGKLGTSSHEDDEADQNNNSLSCYLSGSTESNPNNQHTWNQHHLMAPTDSSPTGAETIQKTIELMKSEHDWMEKMWKAERTSLLRKLEKAEQKNRNCKCGQSADIALEPEGPDSNNIKLSQSASLVDVDKDSLDTLRRRLSDLREENQLLRVSIKRLLTNIYNETEVNK